METLWARMLQADYYHRFYVEQQGRFWWANVLIKTVAILASSSAIYLWFDQYGASSAALASVVAAAASTIDALWGIGDRVFRYGVQAELWSKMMHAYADAYEKSSAGNAPADTDIACLNKEFTHLFAQEPCKPSEKRQLRLYKETLRSHGYSSERIEQMVAGS